LAVPRARALHAIALEPAVRGGQLNERHHQRALDFDNYLVSYIADGPGLSTQLMGIT
jgi:hypothetical protein